MIRRSTEGREGGREERRKGGREREGEGGRERGRKGGRENDSQAQMPINPILSIYVDT